MQEMLKHVSKAWFDIGNCHGGENEELFLISGARRLGV